MGGWFSGGARDYSGLKISNKVKEGERMFLSRTGNVQREQLNTEMGAFTAYDF